MDSHQQSLQRTDELVGSSLWLGAAGCRRLALLRPSGHGKDVRFQPRRRTFAGCCRRPFMSPGSLSFFLVPAAVPSPGRNNSPAAIVHGSRRAPSTCPCSIWAPKIAARVRLDCSGGPAADRRTAGANCELIAADPWPGSKPIPAALTVPSTPRDDHDPSKYWTHDPNSPGSLPSRGRRTGRRNSKGRRNMVPPPRPRRNRR